MTFNRSWYATGTVSVNNASTTLTGSGTSWLSFGIREGDYFFSGGLMVPIAAVGSNTGITLASGWPGSNILGANYYIVPASESVRTVVASRTVLDILLAGNVSALAGLTGANNKGVYFTGANTLALYDLTSAGRAVAGAADAGAQRTAMGAMALDFANATGTIPNARLPSRIQSDCALVTDFNTAIGNGLYVGLNATGTPEAGWFIVKTEISGGQGTQWARSIFVALSDMQGWVRVYNGATWGSWARTRMSQDELDARYGRHAGSFTVGALPTPGVAGRTAWASNCRAFNGAGTQEGPATGTGSLVVDNGSAWKIAGTNVTAVA